jgi:hypothetical protein
MVKVDNWSLRMSSQSGETSNQILKNRHITLLELLDRLIDKGVVAKGEILLSVADVDLVYLNLGLLLSSVKTVENAARRGGPGGAKWIDQQPASRGEFLDELQPGAERKETASTPFLDELQPEVRRKETASKPLPKENSQSSNGKTLARTLPSISDFKRNRSIEPRTNIDPKNVEQGLAKLVLTLVDLIRKLMEKQAIRRVDEGQLDDREIENIGNAFLLLNEKIEQLKETFGLTDEDLNLDLVPLGDLL